MENQHISTTNFIGDSKKFFFERFNLNDEDRALEIETIDEIKKNVVFRGANLWILIFAILICSAGLNVNSTAVVIGAMLISPLMGPIMGVGLGAGIYDFDLIIKSLKNLAIATFISVIASAFYFWISPLDEAQSELLARTSPTLWDVLIAFFGGLAGIVAGSRREKSNAIPGVAIATALMPPLCTAGFGLANGNLDFFFGAMYLFFINSVFISIATYMIIRLLRYNKKEFLDHAREVKVKRYIFIFALLTIIPSVYTAFNIVTKSIYMSNAQNFIEKELHFDHTKVINKEIKYQKDEKEISVALYGQEVSQDLIDRLDSKLKDYNLKDTKLKVYQSDKNTIDENTILTINNEIKTDILQDLYANNENLMKDKNEKIKLLETELINIKKGDIPHNAISKELNAINEGIMFSTLSRTYINDKNGKTIDTVLVAYLISDKNLEENERNTISNYLASRTNIDHIKLLIEKP
jgi:uncharacterized hydrophobic protein (TIGR00271 family)